MTRLCETKMSLNRVKAFKTQILSTIQHGREKPWKVQGKTKQLTCRNGMLSNILFFSEVNPIYILNLHF